MDSGIRLLIASSLAGLVAPQFRAAFSPGTVSVAVDEQQVRRAIADNLRFDVVVADLTWMDAAVLRTFDGLDVLHLVGESGRTAPVVFAAQGHSFERDHLDEAAARAGVAGIVPKAAGVADLVVVIRQVAAGQHPRTTLPPSTRPPLHEYFAAGRRGETAARMAGAIAAGRASNPDTLATAARCSRNTAVKVAEKYLGPLIQERGEHPSQVPLTTQSVYRWCGEHAHYLVSWCRRHGHADVLTKV